MGPPLVERDGDVFGRLVAHRAPSVLASAVRAQPIPCRSGPMSGRRCADYGLGDPAPRAPAASRLSASPVWLTPRYHGLTTPKRGRCPCSYRRRVNCAPTDVMSI